jgi:F0F1-type ATP synthase alpha subunit
VGKGREAQSVLGEGVRVKHYIITISGVDESSEGDIGLFAHEEHQLILNEDEQFVGICFVYTGSKPLQIDSNS